MTSFWCEHQINLSETEWLACQAAHEHRVLRWIEPHLNRSSRNERHPVYDFLFEYYSLRPGQLLRWHPGIGIALQGTRAFDRLGWSAYTETPEGVASNAHAWKPDRRPFVKWLLNLLQATTGRPGHFGCFGLHEWAMVYRTPQVRHGKWPLRFSQAEIARIVDAQPVRCTHYDAFRFFTAEARPLNRWQLARETTSEFEQPGCLHANMDLYKWAYKLTPFAPSELVADAFELAMEIREADMRASPYDLRALGFAPIAIETPEGRAEYERLQRCFSERAAPVRFRLISVCKRLLQTWEQRNPLSPG
ncbi:MAG TPA: hypothetical protein VIT21_00615 [Chthoniobacterales bacterium]